MRHRGGFFDGFWSIGIRVGFRLLMMPMVLVLVAAHFLGSSKDGGNQATTTQKLVEVSGMSPVLEQALGKISAVTGGTSNTGGFGGSGGFGNAGSLGMDQSSLDRGISSFNGTLGGISGGLNGFGDSMNAFNNMMKGLAGGSSTSGGFGSQGAHPGPKFVRP